MIGSAVDGVEARLPWMTSVSNWAELRPLLVMYVGAYFGLPPA
jgi:hypothetical protein